MYDLTHAHWWRPVSCKLYKYLRATAGYAPDAPYPSEARFGDGSYKTLYLAESPEGAVAEFLRRNPEFLEMQDKLAIKVYELAVDVGDQSLDVRDADGQNAVGIGSDRLTSSEPDERVRYAECRALASDVIAIGHIGIGYPSAALTSGAWNLVLFGEPSSRTWRCSAWGLVGTPHVPAADVHALT